MTHVRQEVRFHSRGVLGEFFGAAQVFVGLAARSDVAHRQHGARSLVGDDRTLRDIEREFRGRRARRPSILHSSPPPCRGRKSGTSVLYGLTDEIAIGKAEEKLGLPVSHLDDLAGIRDDHGVRRGFEQRTELLLLSFDIGYHRARDRVGTIFGCLDQRPVRLGPGQLPSGAGVLLARGL